MAKPSLVDVLAAPPVPQSQRCKVGAVLREHPDGEQIKAALDNPAWSAASLARVLKDFGVQLGETTICKHRNRRCAC